MGCGADAWASASFSRRPPGKKTLELGESLTVDQPIVEFAA